MLGGTFDPIHKGHLKLAEAAKAAHGLDQVILVPVARHPLKSAKTAAATVAAAAESDGGSAAPEREPAPAIHRLRMCELARAGRPWLRVSDVDIRRSGPSYTVDTLRLLLARLGAGPELHFLLGADALDTLSKWYRLDECLALARFVVMTRPGYELDVQAALRGRMRTVEFEAVPVSSSAVRARLAEGEAIDDLVPPAIARYIEENALYQKPKEPIVE